MQDTNKLKYSTGWRPEKGLKKTVLDMVEIVFNQESSVNECEMAASTIVEAIHPEIMANATFDELVGGETLGDTLVRLGGLLQSVLIDDQCADVEDWSDWLNDTGQRLNSKNKNTIKEIED